MYWYYTIQEQTDKIKAWNDEDVPSEERTTSQISNSNELLKEKCKAKIVFSIMKNTVDSNTPLYEIKKSNLVHNHEAKNKNGLVSAVRDVRFSKGDFEKMLVLIAKIISEFFISGLSLTKTEISSILSKSIHEVKSQSFSKKLLNFSSALEATAKNIIEKMNISQKKTCKELIFPVALRILYDKLVIMRGGCYLDYCDVLSMDFDKLINLNFENEQCQAELLVEMGNEEEDIDIIGNGNLDVPQEELLYDYNYRPDNCFEFLFVSHKRGNI